MITKTRPEVKGNTVKGKTAKDKTIKGNTCTIVEAREHFSEICEKAAFKHHRFILTRRGKEFVAIVPVEDLKLIEEMEENRLMELAYEALQEGRAKGFHAIEELEDVFGADVFKRGDK